MGVTWRDAVNTVLAGVVATIGLAVTNEWGWPMLGSVRAGTLAAGAVGIAMCTTSGVGRDPESFAPRHPATALMAALGVLSFGLIVAGLISGSELVFMALVVVTLTMWLVTTIRHSLVGSRTSRPLSHPASG